MSHTISEKCNGCGACTRVRPAHPTTGDKKKTHSIDAALCIECCACGRVCPQEGILDSQGNVCTMIKRSEWPKPEITVETCIACGICIDACPAGCLAMSERPREKGVDAYPTLKNAKACIGCGFCSVDCPMGSIVMQKPGKESKKETAENTATASGKSA